MIRKSEEIRDAIRSTDIHARVSYGRHRLVLQEIERATIDIGVGLLFHQGAGDPDQMPLGGYLDNPVVRHLSELKTLREIIEQSPQFAEATKRLVPLHAELAEAEAREAEAATAAQAAQNALEEAEEAARVKLLAKVDQDAAVKAARAQLEALQPAPAAVDPAVAKARAIAAATPRLGKPLGELDHDADPEPLDLDRELAADLH
jgi:hypothetical protein